MILWYAVGIRLQSAVRQKKVQKSLLKKGEILSLEEPIGIAGTHEATLLQFEQFASDWNKDVHGIKKRASNSNKYMQCPNSGLEHSWRTRESCPAYGSECLIVGNPTIKQEYVANLKGSRSRKFQIKASIKKQRPSRLRKVLRCWTQGQEGSRFKWTIWVNCFQINWSWCFWSSKTK